MKKEGYIRIFIVAFAIILYEILTRCNLIDSFTFIPFSEMVVHMFGDLANKEYLMNHFFITSFEIIMSFIGAVFFGIIIGVFLWKSQKTFYIFQPYLMLFYATPFFALYPIFISVLGIGALPVIMIGMFFSLPAVAINTATGFMEIKESLDKVGKSLNLSFKKMIIHIYFPAAWPFIFTGLKLAATYSVIAVIATEFILSARGMGYSISYAYDNFDLVGMYSSILLVLSLSLSVNLILGYIESRLYKKSM